MKPHLFVAVVLTGLGTLLNTAAAAEIVRLGPPLAPVDSSAGRAPLRHTRTDTSYEPTIYEQYMLELINRGRADPNAEAVRYNCDLNEGLPDGTISSDPTQPIAFNVHLIYSAREHSQWMIDNDTFSHTGEGGSSPGDRITAAGYTWTTYGENLAFKGTTGMITDVTGWTGELHKNLYVDEGVSGRGHRKNLMGENWREVGVGMVEGVFTSSGTNYNSLMETEDYGAQGGNPFITGVVYTDLDRDGFYTPGEGAQYPTVTAVNQSTSQTYAATGWYAGGYSLQVPAGTYTVTASGGGLSSAISHTATIGSINVKVDFVPGASTNVAPLVVSGPSATINGLTASLSVTATDADGDTLTYTWSLVTGAGTVSFSVNGTTASASTTATFSAAGDYTLQVAIFDGQNTTTDNLALTVSQPATALTNRTAAAGSTAAGDLYYYFDVPAGAATVTFATTGTSANILNLGVNKPSTGAYPTTVAGSDSALQGLTTSGDESVTFSSPAAGRYYLLVKAVDTGSFNLTAGYNFAPTATAQTVYVAAGTSVAITLAGSDADGDTLAYTVATSPAHGTLSGTAPSLSYAASAAYTGTDSFTFTVGDGQATSSAATVGLTVYASATDPVAQFVTRFYQLCLGRSPDDSGLNGWVGNLKSGAATGADAGTGFIFSTEFQARNLDDSAWLDVLYQAFFDRTADDGGKSGWLAQMGAGTTRTQVLAGFTHGTEFINLCAVYGITPYAGYSSDPVVQFVARFYTLCLERDPDTAGLNAWVDNLKSGASTGANVGSGFIFSPEFQARSLDNSAWLDVLYSAFFNRTADEAGKAGWLAQLNGGTSKQTVLDGFTHGAEFSALCVQYGITPY